jgi:uncharacterized protein
MWRLIFLGILIWLIVYFVKRYLRQQQGHSNHEHTPTETTGTMVKCETCGIHLPKSDAYQHNNLFYCSQAHLPKPSA